MVISKTSKPDFEMIVEGVFSTREKANNFWEEIQQWKMENGIYTDGHFIWETSVDPEIPEQSYYDVKMPYANQDIIITPLSFNSDMWLINQDVKPDEVITGTGWWILSSLVKASTRERARIKGDELFREYLKRNEIRAISGR